MKDNVPFLIDVSENLPENHIPETADEMNFPFEFSATNVWKQNLLTPEPPTDISAETIYTEIKEIRQLLYDIKNYLSDIFEMKKDLD